MSDSTNSNDLKAAKADAKAAKARAKAMRPWFKKKRFILPIALVVLIGVSTSLGNKGGNSNSDTSNNSSSDESNNSNSEETVAKIGDSVVSGDLTFIITGFKCGISSVGSSLVGTKAQGQFCEVSVSVTNTGKESQSLLADNQKLYDVAGAEYSPDTTASIYVENGSIYEDINPGNTLKGVIIYDVPKTFEVDYIKVAAGYFSESATVSLKN